MSTQHQDELPLSGLAAHAVWPGRVLLYVIEVAEKLHCSDQHVWNLIEEGQLIAIDIATKKQVVPGQIDRRRRGCFRVPVCAWDKFIEANVSK